MLISLWELLRINEQWMRRDPYQNLENSPQQTKIKLHVIFVDNLDI